MKKITFILFCSFWVLNSYSQELILPDSIINFYKINKIAYDYSYDKDNYKNAIQLYYDVLSFPIADERSKSAVYINIADIYAEYQQYDSAVVYYDKAFYSKRMDVESFGRLYRKKYFAADTSLYMSKMEEYKENFGKLYSYDELYLMREFRAMNEADQLARNFDTQYPNSCRKNILMYTDSLNMVKIVEIINKNPDMPNPFRYGGWAYFIVGRHIFSAYPEFWLTYIEPIERQSLINGYSDVEAYTRTYDRCVIFARDEYSYYGEFDDNGRKANPDTALVNQRRKNVGLPPLDQKVVKPNTIFITY
ncbi:MAG TPA: hypothetical protein PLH70_04375 [Bacteroidales bacterium]|nr:hypothetical protein [Bacteroidales bacterium]HOH22386.1 hypothetical protein [Bacteroidales bacterium]HPZ03049.1 hypothetical protein [Bacteroidales bacterium]HQB75018.1 hypothetical protein [Bacteroidales bacterium]